jgi:hypothetical protein
VNPQLAGVELIMQPFDLWSTVFRHQEDVRRRAQLVRDSLHMTNRKPDWLCPASDFMNFRFEVTRGRIVWKDQREVNLEPLGLRIVDSSNSLDPLAVLFIEIWIRDDRKPHLTSRRCLTSGIPERLDDKFLAFMGELATVETTLDGDRLEPGGFEQSSNIRWIEVSQLQSKHSRSFKRTGGAEDVVTMQRVDDLCDRVVLIRF